MNGDLPPEVWAEREVAATLNLNDLGSESRAVDLVVSEVADTLRSHPRPGSNSTGAIVAQALAVRGRDGGAQLEIGPEGVYNALRASSRTPLIAIAATGDTTHALTSEGADASETSVRRLTPVECERLQGFPDGWTLTSNGKPQADSARYRQMGNAVAVPCVEWIVRRILAVEES